MSDFGAFHDFRMNNHVAIVTGGAQNIGEAIALILTLVGRKILGSYGISQSGVQTAFTTKQLP